MSQDRNQGVACRRIHTSTILNATTKDSETCRLEEIIYFYETHPDDQEIQVKNLKFFFFVIMWTNYHTHAPRTNILNFQLCHKRNLEIETF